MQYVPITPVYTRRDYYLVEKMSELRHEFCGGSILPKVGESPIHNRLVARMTTHLNNRMRDDECFVVCCAQRVRIEAEDLETYPDVVAYYENAAFDSLDAHTLLEPRILVEVLSPSTAEYDRTTKLEAYKRIPSLTDYFLVWQDKICVEHHQRGEDRWYTRRCERRSDEFLIEEFDCEVHLAEIYRRLELPEGVEN